MATLKDVAQLAQVSLSTASRILSASSHGSARYSQETYKRVMQASQELGYQPNLPARALASGRTHIIAVVYPRVISTPFAAPFVTKLVEHIEMRCSELGFHMLLSAPKIGTNGPEESYVRLINSGYLEGVILIDSFKLPSLLSQTTKHGLPLIVAGGQEPGYASVQFDDQEGSYLIAKHLLDLGHRKVGIIGIPDELNHRASVRFEGFRRAFAEQFLSIEHLARIDGDFTKESGEQAAYTLLSQDPDLTALMALNDRMAAGAYRAARALGRKIPEDLSITGFDDLPIASDLTPLLTTVHQPIDDLGQLLVDNLISVINGKTPKLVTLMPSLKVRESTAVPKLLMEVAL